MTGVIIQARMGSTRLPGKILLPISGKPLLELIQIRLSQMKTQVVTVVATSTKSRDDSVEELCAKKGWNVFRGSESNVLERYVMCARQYGVENVVRLTGDNPFVDPQELDQLIAKHICSKADYSTSISKLPIGVGAEIFTIECLEMIFRNATQPHHFEHVNEYLFENVGMFKVIEVEPSLSKQQSDIRLTVDTERDYQRACFIAEEAGHSFVTTDEAIKLADQFESKCSVFA